MTHPDFVLNALPVNPDLKFNFFPITTDIHCGYGALADLPKHIGEHGGTKAVLVTDPGLRKAGVAGRVEAVLKNAGIPFVSYDKVPENSSTGVVNEIVALINESGADALIGLGGGSPIDTAKIAAAMATHGGRLADYMGLHKFHKPSLPVIAIPTAAGTGAEVSIFAVVTEDETETKIPCGGKTLLPRVALLDPELTVSLPPKLTAATGMDALGHAMECFVNTACQPISGSLAWGSMTLVGRYLRRAVKDGTDREARYGMLLASTLGLMAMDSTRVGPAHAISIPLGSWGTHLHHGLLIAILLPPVMAFNCEAAPERYAAVARALGESVEGLPAVEAAHRSVEAVRRLNADIGIPPDLKQFNVPANLIDPILDEAMKSGNILVNPRKISRDDLAAILNEVL
jgi:alcohol dehydrogenase class IV